MSRIGWWARHEKGCWPGRDDWTRGRDDWANDDVSLTGLIGTIVESRIIAAAKPRKNFTTEEERECTEDHGEEMMTLRAVPDQTMREALEFLTAPWSSVHSRSSSVVKFFLARGPHDMQIGGHNQPPISAHSRTSSNFMRCATRSSPSIVSARCRVTPSTAGPRSTSASRVRRSIAGSRQPNNVSLHAVWYSANPAINP
jgi:hypothetical protein